MTPSLAISVRDLRKSYGDHQVLGGIDLAVPAGTVFALLGPNGSGKTTTVRILSTLTPADAGEVRITGHDVQTEAPFVRAAIGVTGQFSAVDDLLTGEENLLLMADLHHLPGGDGRRRVAELLVRFDLHEAAHKRVATYSGGMRRRLDLAMTLVGNPRVIFLDEPTTGLDPRSRRELWQIVHELVATGVTIFLTTQYLDEADELADRIAMLDRGRIIAYGTPAELKRSIPGGHLQVQFTDEQAMAAAAAAHPEATGDPETFIMRIPSDGTLRSMRAVLEQLDEDTVTGVAMHTPDLDDVFLALTGPNADRSISNEEKELV